MTDHDEHLIDLDAFAPAPGARVKFREKTYLVKHFQDLPLEDAMRLLRAEQELRGKTVAEQIELGVRLIGALVPGMDRATLQALTPHQILLVVQRVMGVAEVPPPADAAPSGSGISSPASAGSSDGAGAKFAA